VSDADFINEKWNKTIQKFLEDYNKWEKHTLAEYIRECAEIIERKIELGLIQIEKSKISSYLFGEFKKQEIEVSDRTIQRSLSPEYKQTEKSPLKADTMSTSAEPIKTVFSSPDSVLLGEVDQYNTIYINGIRYEPVREKRESLTDVFTVDVTPFIDDTYITILNASKTCNRWEAFFSSICEYYMDRNTSHLIIKNIKTTDKLSNEEKEKFINEFKKRAEVSNNVYNHIQEAFKNDKAFFTSSLAQSETARKEVDKREKWGNYSKILMHYLTTIINKANLAELVGYCSKYTSIGIERNDEVTKFHNWLLSCPKCKTDIHYEMNQCIEEELRLDEAGLPSKIMPKPIN
jgi:hypothetical protein